MDGTVEGTIGNDLINDAYAGDLEGDRIDAGDAVDPAAGPDDDVVLAGPGNDRVFAADGDDEVYGGLDDDELNGGNGNDSLYGDEGQDLLRGDAGDDALFGGAGEDTLKGGLGDDVLDGGEGADFMGGGADADTFIATAGDTVDGGFEGVDEDVLDLSGIGPYRLEGLTPDLNGNGFDGTVVLLDANGVPTGETIAFTEIESIIDDSNQDPVALDDTATTPEDTPVVIDVLANDTDPQGQPLTVTEATAPNGTVTINPDGTLEYDPNPDFNGPDVITYTVTDPDGNEATATVAVEVTPVNDPPDAVDDPLTQVEPGATVIIPVLGNDTDPDSDPLTVTEASAPNGTVAILPDGTLEYTPNAGYIGPDEISYTITDGNGGFDTAFVPINVEDTQSPVAGDDTATTPEDTPVVIDVLANDTDPQGQPLTVTEATAPNGTVTINPDGTLEYDPNPDFNGPDVITYTVTDPDGNEATATVAVEVTPVNDPPDAVDDPLTQVEPGATVIIPVLGNDTDPDSDPLTVTEASAPNGTVAILPDGTLEYTPNAGYIGPDEISYTITDGNGGFDTAFVPINVEDTQSPVAGDDTATTPEDTPVVIDVLANDTDPQGQPLTVTEATAPNGTVTINPDGTLEYDPNPDFNGPDVITYTVTDPDGNTDTATVAVDVTPVNDLPDAVDDPLTTIGAGETVIITVLGNDSDPDGDPLTVTEASAPNGTVEILPDGTLSYTPDAGYDGPDEITYTITDGNGGFDTAMVPITVTELPPLPLDGTVTGTSGDDLIDADYMGDPDGDMVDNDDAILPGDVGNDDLILAGAGNDTILAADGDDEVFGQGGDDSILGGIGNDEVYGGVGNDVIDTSDGGIGAFDNPYPPLTVDAFPENDLDTVFGGAGDDVIRTGDDADEVYGGGGNDDIDAGIDNDYIEANAGDDTVVGGEGSDTIYGGYGNDLILGGLDPRFPDTLNIPNDEGDLVTNNGQDLIFGGDGDDTIFGQDDDDVIYGGYGNDSIDGGIDDDTIFGGADDDVVTGGQGNDVLEGNFGNDTVFGGEGDDTLFGQGDDDELFGGDGDDVIEGNNGNDTITGGAGADTLFGNADRDLFIGGNGGDVVDGGSGGDDFDTLDLTGSDVDFITYTSPDREDGIVTFLDGSTMTFQEIENVIPCFTPGTTIATPRGERLVEELREGDRIITRDNGIQEIRWVGQKVMTGKALVGSPHLRPIMIKAGALGNGLPERDMLVSPNHRLLVANDRTQLYFEESEVLAAAKHLVGTQGIHELDVMSTTYIHFMFDRHEVVLSNGAWTESFQPGDYSLKGLGNSQRNEIFELFPELKSKTGLEGYQSARKSLKKHEARLLVK